MTSFSAETTIHLPAEASPAPAAHGLLPALLRWFRHRRSERAISELSDETRKDIGLDPRPRGVELPLWLR